MRAFKFQNVSLTLYMIAYFLNTTSALKSLVSLLLKDATVTLMCRLFRTATEWFHFKFFI